jgi:hypothetical protein
MRRLHHCWPPPLSRQDEGGSRSMPRSTPASPAWPTWRNGTRRRRGGGRAIVVVNVVNVVAQEGQRRRRSADCLHPNGGGLVNCQRVPTGQRRDERAGEDEWQQDDGEGGCRQFVAVAVGEIGVNCLPGRRCAVLDEASTLRRRLRFGRGNDNGGGGR